MTVTVGVYRYLGKSSKQLQGSQRNTHVLPPLGVEPLGDQMNAAHQQPCRRIWKS